MIKEYGYEYDAVLNVELWEKTRGKVTSERLNGAYCLRSGRDALKAIAQQYQPRIVLLPALSCESMIFPFELFGHKVKFYKLKNDYSIDFEDLYKKIVGENELFLYMDYFGNQSISDIQLEILKERGLVLIEDRTHSLFGTRSRFFKPDYIIASLRKWFPIPDGGLLWGNVNEEFGIDTCFAELRLKAQLMRHDYLQNGNEQIKTEYRKIFANVSSIMKFDKPCAMSAYSYALVQSTDWKRVHFQRKRNADVLSKMLSPYSFGNSCLYVPFMVDKRDDIQKVLSSVGIFNTIIWPLKESQRRACETAKHTETHILAAPCDQRYNEEDMEYIGKEILRVIENG